VHNHSRVVRIVSRDSRCQSKSLGEKRRARLMNAMQEITGSMVAKEYHALCVPENAVDLGRNNPTNGTVGSGSEISAASARRPV
jgi:hypothetical protein